jgi:hypothetical protein
VSQPNGTELPGYTFDLRAVEAVYWDIHAVTRLGVIVGLPLMATLGAVYLSGISTASSEWGRAVLIGGLTFLVALFAFLMWWFGVRSWRHGPAGATVGLAGVEFSYRSGKRSTFRWPGAPRCLRLLDYRTASDPVQRKIPVIARLDREEFALSTDASDAIIRAATAYSPAVLRKDVSTTWGKLVCWEIWASAPARVGEDWSMIPPTVRN